MDFMELEKQTMTLDEQIARLRKLDKERTQGEWRIDYSKDGGHDDDPVQEYADSIYVRGNSASDVTICEFYSSPRQQMDYVELTPDQEFLFAAPAMMQIINQLQAKLQVAEGALESITKLNDHNFTLYHAHLTAKEALAQIRGEHG